MIPPATVTIPFRAKHECHVDPTVTPDAGTRSLADRGRRHISVFASTDFTATGVLRRRVDTGSGIGPDEPDTVDERAAVGCDG